jgi:hypothetical protein
MFKVQKEPDSIPPTLTITFPPDQAILSDTVLVSAYAFDNVELGMVTLYLNDSAIISSKDAPYEYTWITTDYAEDEQHTIWAKAEDAAGNLTQTNPIRVLIDNLDNINPTGTLIFPYTGQTISGEITIIVEANDNEEVAFVNVYIDGDTVATLTESPYTFNWDTSVEVDDINYTIHVHIQDVTGNQITLGPISVLIDNYEADDNIPPTGTIIHPPSAATVSETILIQVSAYDNVEMGFVDFIIDGSFAGQDSVLPYEYQWNTTVEVEDADHIINVNLTDAVGNTTALFPVTVRVNNIDEPDIIPPNVVIYEPAANQTVSGMVNITAIATDNVSINRVEFYHNYELEFIVTSYPYQYEWNSTDAEDDSEHIWYVKAFDTSENNTQTQPIAVFVDNEDDIPPTGFILYPYAGQTVSGIVQIQVSVSDNLGIDQVEFFIEGNTIGTNSEYPYSKEWNTENTELATEDEEHVISITITDLGGNSTDVSPISVLVNNIVIPGDDTTPPVVAILTPVSSQTVGDTVLISGFAIDNMGIEDVKFYVDDELVATVSDSPYTHNWVTYELSNGSDHVIQMTATDLSDNQTTAQPVFVTVQNEYYGEIENFSLSVSEENISLSWDAPYNAETFKVYRDSVFLAEISNQSYDDTIEAGVEYCYQISAVNSVGIEGPWSDEECGIPQLPAPESFSIAINDTNITLVWAAVDNASGYIIYRDNTEIWNGTALTLTDLGLAYNTTYIYNVVAFDLEGTNGTESDPLSVTMPEELIAPDLSLSISGTYGSLNWTSLSTATAYRVHKDSVIIEEVTATNYEIELIHGVEACFTITAINDVGSESDPSNEECGTGDFTAPVLSLSVTDSTASLNWNSVVSAENYWVYQDSTFLIEVSNHYYNVEIGTGTETCFGIEAVNSYGTTSDTSNVECGTGS